MDDSGTRTDLADHAPDRPRLDWRGLGAELATPLHGAGEAARLWVAGSLVLSRAVCSCIGRVATQGWRSLRTGDNAAPPHEAALIATLVVVVGGTAAVGALGGLVYVARPYLPVILPSAGAIWTLAAWMVAPRTEPTNHNAPEESDEHELMGETGEKPQDAAAAEDTARLHVEHLVAVARAEGRNGVHLADMLPELQAVRPDATVSDLRTTLKRLGIPVRDQLKIGKSNRAGIHHDDLQRTLGHRPRLPPHMVPDLTPAQDGPTAPDRAPQDAPPDAPKPPTSGAARPPVAGPVLAADALGQGAD